MQCICPERKFRLLLSIPPATEMFHFAGCASTYVDSCQWQEGFPIRKFTGQRLFGTSPKLIAAITRPSSLLGAKASTIHPYIPVRNTTYRSIHLPEHVLCTAAQFWVCPVSEKYNNQNRTCFLICWGRKDPPFSNCLYPTNRFYLQRVSSKLPTRYYHTHVECVWIFRNRPYQIGS